MAARKLRCKQISALSGTLNYDSRLGPQLGAGIYIFIYMLIICLKHISFIYTQKDFLFVICIKSFTLIFYFLSVLCLCYFF